ncbi:hypothetical protein [Corynebacterium resistens]|uniref:hypothetical protein n=1 Tax=Corynebacterium resistens TaxID=258224 RepID=UPI002357A5F1|nr:hypothetical protein [Corynebacterium resistens]
MDIFIRATPEPPHALRQHFAMRSHSCDTHTVYSIAPMQFGGSHTTDATRNSPHTSALAEIPPEHAASQAVLFIAPHSPSEPFTNRHWDLVWQLAETDLRVEIPIPRANKTSTSPSTPPPHPTTASSTHPGTPSSTATASSTGSATIRQTYRNLLTDHGPQLATAIAESSCIPELLDALQEATAPRTIVLLAPQAKDITLLKQLFGADSPIADRALDTEVHIFFAKKDKGSPGIVDEASKLKKIGATVILHESASGDRLYHLRRSKAGRAARKAIISVAHNTAARDI